MELIIIISEFLSLLKEAIKIIPKNGKLTASLSLLLPSILFLSLSHLCRQYVVDDGPDSGSYMLVLADFALLLVYPVISHVSVIAAILVAASTSCSHSISSKDLFAASCWRKTLSAVSHVPRQTRTTFLLFIFYLPYLILLLILYPDILISISNMIIAWIVIIDFMVYSSSDVWALALVVLVLQEEEEEEEETSGSCCSEVMEKLGDVVEGHQLKGGLLNLFNNLLFLIVCVLFWVFRYQNPTLYGLIFINALSTMKMVLFMAYAVLYFQCKKKKHPVHGGGDIC